MKLNGIKLAEPKPRVLVIPHGDQELVFTAKYVGSFDGHDERFPAPEVPEKLLPGGQRIPHYDHPKYMKLQEEWNEQRFVWLYFTSLGATEGLEWDYIKVDDPTTWKHFDKEFDGVQQNAIERLKYHVMQTCGMDPARIDEATERFLADRLEAQNPSTSPSTEPSSTPSTEHVKG